MKDLLNSGIKEIEAAYEMLLIENAKKEKVELNMIIKHLFTALHDFEEVVKEKKNDR